MLCGEVFVGGVFMIKIALLFMCVTSYIFANNGYEVPPSSSTFGYAPVISDRQVEECVRVYNNILRMERNYSSSVSQYNNSVDWYNNNCAGKQSQSAYESTNRRQQKNGRF